MNLRFIQNIEKDIQNWQNAIGVESYGVKWKNYMPEDISIDCVTNSACLLNYLKNNYYGCDAIKGYVEKLEKKVNVSEIEIDLQFIMGQKFPNETINIFITTFRRAPYNVKNNFFYLHYYAKDNEFDKAVTNIYHELMHFLFHWYYWNKCRSLGLTDAQISILKESLTVLLNPILKKRGLVLDRGYKDHQVIRTQLTDLWEKENDFNTFLEKAVINIKSV